MVKLRKIKKRNKVINRDISHAVDIIMYKLDRIEQKLDDKIQIEPEQKQTIILNLNQKASDQA